MGRADFHRAFVVSDLHLGGANGFQMFAAGKQFESLCRLIAASTEKSKPTLLLINGDFVDFLAEPNAGYWNGETAAFRLGKIANRAAFRPVFAGLKRYVARTGAHLTLVLGNHDLELALPEVQETFLELIGADATARRARVEFAFDGNGYRFQVGRGTALATHGNEVDPYNFTRFDLLQQINRELVLDGFSGSAEGWRPSAGTAFVIDAINVAKRNYPFVDLLKPEEVVGVSLVVLDPKNLTLADEFAALLAGGLKNEDNRPESERRFLEFDPLAAVDDSGARTLLLELKANQYVRNPNLDPEDLISAGVEGTLGFTDWVESARSAVEDLVAKGIRQASDAIDSARRTAHAETLRRTVRPFVSDEVLEVRRLGKADGKLLKMVRRPYDVVFTGHTHARRFCAVESNVGHLVNTGTWAGLMRLSEADVASRRRFRPFYELLVNPLRTALTDSRWYAAECPVAVMTSMGETTTLSLQRMDESGKLERADQSGRTFDVTLPLD